VFGIFGGLVPCERGTCTSQQYCDQTGGESIGYCFEPHMTSRGVCCSCKLAYTHSKVVCCDVTLCCSRRFRSTMLLHNANNHSPKGTVSQPKDLKPQQHRCGNLKPHTQCAVTVRESCGQSTSDNVALFRNPSYPSMNWEPVNCAFSMVPGGDVCGIRYDEDNI
jgi:hypothetical protein